MENTITVEVTIASDPKKVWDALTSPLEIKEWCHASDDWGVGIVENDLRVGGRFITHMMAKDESEGFDFSGTYTRVDDLKGYTYTMDGDDRRTCVISLEEVDGNTKVTETFDIEQENAVEQQRRGWQSILENLKKYVESKV